MQLRRSYLVIKASSPRQEGWLTLSGRLVENVRKAGWERQEGWLRVQGMTLETLVYGTLDSKMSYFGLLNAIL